MKLSDKLKKVGKIATLATGMGATSLLSGCGALLQGHGAVTGTPGTWLLGNAIAPYEAAEMNSNEDNVPNQVQQRPSPLQQRIIQPIFVAYKDFHDNGDGILTMDDLRGINNRFYSDERFNIIGKFPVAANDYLEAKLENLATRSVVNKHQARVEDNAFSRSPLCVYKVEFKITPRGLSPGPYRTTWYKNGNLMGSNDIEVLVK